MEERKRKREKGREKKEERRAHSLRSIFGKAIKEAKIPSPSSSIEGPAIFRAQRVLLYSRRFFLYIGGRTRSKIKGICNQMHF